MPAQRDCARTLAVAAWFAKYDPDQPRVPRGNTGGGQWAASGAAGVGASGADGAAAVRSGAVGSREPALPSNVAAFLGTVSPATAAPLFGRPASMGEVIATGAGARTAAAEMAAAGLGALAAPVAFGAVLLGAPSSAGVAADGTLPDHPEIHYRYDEDRLTVYRQDLAGNGTILFSGWPGRDGVWRDAAGVAIGRSLGPGRGFLLNQNALEQASERAAVGAAADDTRDQPRLCPDPGLARPGWISDRSQAYQSKVTGLPPGLAVMLNGVEFDGCKTKGIQPVMLEAKAWGYAPRGISREALEWRDGYQGRAKTLKQMTNQSIAAGSWTVEWHVAELRFSELLSREAQAFPNIVIMYDPYADGGRRVKWNTTTGKAEIEP